MTRVPRFSVLRDSYSSRPSLRRRRYSLRFGDPQHQKSRISVWTPSPISVVLQDDVHSAQLPKHKHASPHRHLLCCILKSPRARTSSLPDHLKLRVVRVLRKATPVIRMSGGRYSSPYGSSPSGSPRQRCQSTSSGDSDANAAALPVGRERLNINFLAGQQPRSASTGGSGSGANAPDYVRQRVASTHVPGASSTRHRSFVPIPSALGRGGATPTFAIPATPPDARGRSYRLDVEQHPERTAEYGPAVLSRLPLAPPPIVRLTITDHTGSPINPSTELPFLVAHLSLCSETGAPLDTDAAGATYRLLYGTLVSSAQILRNLRGHNCPYFIFPDVSVRQRGRYTLKITLMRLPRIGTPASMSSDQGSVLATTYTNVFEVVSQSNYVAPQLTQLTQLFIRQGARMYAFESSIHNQPLMD